MVVWHRFSHSSICEYYTRSAGDGFNYYSSVFGSDALRKNAIRLPATWYTLYKCTVYTTPYYLRFVLFLVSFMLLYAIYFVGNFFIWNIDRGWNIYRQFFGEHFPNRMFAITANEIYWTNFVNIYMNAF